MATHVNSDDQIVISSDDARGGVTGHNVRYVLEYSMIGIIAAFAAIGLYAGFDSLQATLSAAFSQGLTGILRDLAPFAVIAILGATGVWLLLQLWTALSGPSGVESQRFMRARVVTQFAIICALIAVSYLSVA